MAKRIRTIETDVFGKFILVAPINSKLKGNSNELVAAKFMEKWTGKKWTRTPSSGGLRWKDAPNVCGDIVCEESSFYSPVSIETKHLKSLTFSKNLRSNSKIYTILEQAKMDADRSGRKPLLLLRKNGMPAGTFVVYLTVKVEATCISEGMFNGLNVYGYKSAEILNKVSWEEFICML